VLTVVVDLLPMARFLAAVLVLAAAVVGVARAQVWKTSGNLVVQSNRHAAVALANGQVLLSGGFDGTEFLARAELFNPTTLLWSLTGAMATGREDHTATLLPTGSVLVAGGSTPVQDLADCELYTPASGTWTAAAPMAVAHALHTATGVGEGDSYRVLVAGGQDINFASTRACELYNPTTNTWATTGQLNEGRFEHTATLLPDGRVLVAGGYGDAGDPLATAETYAVGTGQWTLLSAVMSTPRVLHAAALMQTGLVIVCGGQNVLGVYQASTDLFNPATNTWTVGGSMNTQRGFHTLTPLSSGNILAVAGQNLGGFPTTLDSSEVFNPDLRLWTTTATLEEGRTRHTATLMSSGEVLVAGGQVRACVGPLQAPPQDAADDEAGRRGGRYGDTGAVQQQHYPEHGRVCAAECHPADADAGATGGGAHGERSGGHHLFGHLCRDDCPPGDGCGAARPPSPRRDGRVHDHARGRHEQARGGQGCRLRHRLSLNVGADLLRRRLFVLPCIGRNEGIIQRKHACRLAGIITTQTHHPQQTH
jgi:hypothetical protein